MVTKNVAVRFLQQVLQFAIILLIAKIAGPAGYGYFSIFITEVAVMHIITGLSLEGPVLFFVSKNKLSLSAVFNLAFYLLMFQAAAFAVIYFIAKYFFSYTLFLAAENKEGVFWAAGYVFSLLIYNYCNAYLAGKGRFFSQVYWVTIFQVLFLLVVFLLYRLQIFSISFFNKSENLIPLFCCMFIVQAVIGVFLVGRFGDEKIKIANPFKQLPEGFVKYASLVFYANVIQFFSYRADIWILDFFKAKADVGQYSLAVKTGQIWWMLPQLLSTMIFPLTALQHNGFSETKFKKYIKLTVIAGLLGGVAAAFMLPYFISGTAGDVYMPAYYLLLILLPGILFFSVTVLLAAKLSGEGNIKINLQTSALCFVVMIVFDFILIPLYGSNGAAAASSAAYTVSSIFIILKYKKWNKEKK